MLLVTINRGIRAILEIPIKYEIVCEPLYTAYYHRSDPTYTIFTKHTLTNVVKSDKDKIRWELSFNPYNWQYPALNVMYYRVNISF